MVFLFITVVFIQAGVDIWELDSIYYLYFNRSDDLKNKHKVERHKKLTRGEQLRQAARRRRDREIELYKELSDLLPFSQDMTSKLNNSDIMRLVVSYIEMKNYALEYGKL